MLLVQKIKTENDGHEKKFEDLLYMPLRVLRKLIN